MQTLHNSTQETFYKVLLLHNTAENCDWISHDGEYSGLLGNGVVQFGNQLPPFRRNPVLRSISKH
jgi:hypothetical protein